MDKYSLLAKIIFLKNIRIRSSDLKSEKNEMGCSKSVKFSQAGGYDGTRGTERGFNLTQSTLEIRKRKRFFLVFSLFNTRRSSLP